MAHDFDPDCSCFHCDKERAKKDNLQYERKLRQL